MNQLSLFFSPQGVILVGASSNSGKLSYGILRNMLQYGFKGGVYPVNPGVTEILGIPCYPSISNVPDPVDLAVIIIPAPQIPDALTECGKKGIKAAIIISGGFKEIGGQGVTLENKVIEIGKYYGIRLIGPNCVGTADLYSGLNTTFIKGLPETGPICFISQSGAVCGGVVDYMLDKGGAGFSHFVSLGNEADISETDMIEFLAEDPNVGVLAVYVEAIKDGRRFIEVARRVIPNKPIVLLKAGRSEAGARAVSSHTGSIAGSLTAYQTAFQQSGVISAKNVADLFDLSFALSSKTLPRGNRVAILTNAGGPAALASDSLAANGMVLIDLSQETRTKLRPLLNPSAQVGNPVDMLGGATPDEYFEVLEVVLADPKVDAALAILVPQALVDPAEVAAAISKVAKASSKPVTACIMGAASVKEAQKVFNLNHIPMFTFPESAARALGIMYQYFIEKNKGLQPVEIINHYGQAKAEEIIKSNATSLNLGEAATRPLLEAYGIPVISAGLASNPVEASDIARQIGFPVVVKIVSRDILHKSDIGGIRLNLSNEAEVIKATQDLLEHIHNIKPEANIEGVLVESMAQKGHEVIIGMKRDPSFGPLLMFGLGGIFVELITDVSFGIAPLSKQEADAMIYRTKAGKLLSGLRGQKPADIQAVSDCILRLSQLAMDFPEIEEIEINPLLVLPEGKGAIALDARAILSHT